MHPLLDRVEATCRAAPTRPAVCDQSLVLDQAGLRAVAVGLGQQIAPATERPHVGILAPTSAAAAAAILACWYARRVPVPLNFLLGDEELERIVRDAELDLVLAVEPWRARVRNLGAQDLVLNATTLVPGQGDAPPAEAGDLAVILYTSGTSGEPKGVCLTFDNLAQNALACAEHARITPEQVWLSVLPQFHTFGFTALTVTPRLLGATVHYLPRFSPVAVANTIAERDINILMAIPSMYAALANLKAADRRTFASLTYAISGGEPLPDAVFDAFAERFGVTLYQGYGLTESSPVATLATPWQHRRGTVGKPIPGVRVEAVDEAGATLPPNGVGELVIRGHGVMRGYHNRHAETAQVLRAGALWTGDIGHVDDDGFVHITGRAREMIIVGGENVFPREIECVLAAHPAVHEVAVIGMRDEVRGETPLAYVLLRTGKDAGEGELRDYCRQRLAAFKVPRRVIIAEDLPRTPTGKILKRALPRNASP